YGFDHDRLAVAEFEPASAGYDAERSARYAAALLARARALPGVSAAALADNVPFFIGYDRLTAVSSTGARCEAGASGCAHHATLSVGPGYFAAMGIALTSGREFADGGAATDIV